MQSPRCMATAAERLWGDMTSANFDSSTMSIPFSADDSGTYRKTKYHVSSFDRGIILVKLSGHEMLATASFELGRIITPCDAWLAEVGGDPRWSIIYCFDSLGLSHL